MSDKQTWKEPVISKIRMLDGTIAEAQVNGLSDDRKTCYAFVGGKEVKVMWYKGEWSEDPFIDEGDLS